MRDADEAALVADGVDRLGGRQARRDRPLDEGGDQVTVRMVRTSSPTITVSPSGAASRAAERAIDPVVVGDDEVGQPTRGRGAHDLRRISQAVEGRRRVAMQVDEGAARRDHAPGPCGSISGTGVTLRSAAPGTS